MIRVAVQTEPIDVAAELAEIEAAGVEAAGVEAAGVGAVASFTGLVRSDAKDDERRIEMLELEHYPGVTEAALRALAEAATARWSLLAATVVHRVGAMRPGERIVLVATAAPHRAAALEACAYLIDRLKTDAPFWKRETRGGEGRWVEARVADDAAAARWDGG